MRKYSKYLPSKKFTLIMGSFVIVLAIIFFISFLTSKKESFVNNNNTTLKTENQNVLDFIQIDTDLDSISDWEEALWGTDKNKKRTFNDIPDGTYIENKKKELNIEQEQNDRILTETDKFAREFFTAYTALRASGQVDEDTINNFSNALGQDIVNPDLIDTYLKTDMKVNNTDNTNTREKYYSTIKNFFDNYRELGLGEELDIVNNELIIYGSTGESIQQNKLLTIARAYKDFSEKVVAVNVPISLLDYHLKIANSANNIGISVSNMAKVINDPIVGLSGLSQYQKYSDDLVNAVEDLENAL
jgi:hypothetical protein